MARPGVVGDAYTRDVSIAEDPHEVGRLTVLPPVDALGRAHPLPGDEDMVIEGLTDEEWAAFEQALTDR